MPSNLVRAGNASDLDFAIHGDALKNRLCGESCNNRVASHWLRNAYPEVMSRSICEVLEAAPRMVQLALS